MVDATKTDLILIVGVKEVERLTLQQQLEQAQKQVQAAGALVEEVLEEHDPERLKKLKGVVDVPVPDGDEQVEPEAPTK